MIALCSVLCEQLLAWYACHARDLPWRRTRNPYAIWISEIMLQQTRVSTVLPRYRLWMKRFPDVVSFAEASEEQVLKAWEGLGYYRRARYAWLAAKTITREHAGVFPCDFASILALPGIGRSTAGAIASFAFDCPTPVLDGNVRRVLIRLFGESTLAEQWRQAESLLRSSGQPAVWNQAMMELGARVCVRRPSCEACPIRDHCHALRSGVDGYASSRARKSKKPPEDVHWKVCIHRREDGRVWMQQRPRHGIWGGLWAPPIHELSEAPSQEVDLVHPLTHRRLHLYACDSCEFPLSEGAWFHLDQAPAMPTGIRRLLHRLGLNG